MGAFMTHRYAGGSSPIILKNDLITQAKQKAHELGANAIVECKIALNRGLYFVLLFQKGDTLIALKCF